MSNVLVIGGSPFVMDSERFVRLLVGRARAVFIDEVRGAFREHGAAKTSMISEVDLQEHRAEMRRYGVRGVLLTELVHRALLSRYALRLAAQRDLAYALRGIRRRLPGGPPASAIPR